jgi:hypothetical protein
MLTFYDVFTQKDKKWTWSVDIAPLFKDLKLREQQNNIQYFLDNFNSQEIQNLDALNKHLLFISLGVQDSGTVSLIEKQKENWFMLYFKMGLLFQAFEKEEELVLKVVDYFNDNINYYFKSQDFVKKVIMDSNYLNEYFKKYCGIDHSDKFQIMGIREPFEHQLISEEITQKTGLSKLRALLYTNSQFSYDSFDTSKAILVWLDTYEEKKLLEQKVFGRASKAIVFKV